MFRFRNCCRVQNACVSECEVLPIQIPRSIQVPGPVESPSDHADEYLCLDSDNEQELRANRPMDNKLLSSAKQLIEFDDISHSTKLLHPQLSILILVSQRVFSQC